jgi:beta-galactosidase GanA
MLPILALAFTFGAGTADAAGEKIVDWRQSHQEQRTGSGVAGGSLTQRETARMEWRSSKLNAAEDQALSDGQMSAGEARRLNRAYDRQSRFIYRQKHDGQSQ